jgi:predicted nucleic acid-binding protein
MVVTALDTNVLVTLFKADNPNDVATAQAALERASETGTLLISPVVYAELLAIPLQEEFLEAFLKKTHIAVEWRMERDIWKRAGHSYYHYAQRRRKQKDDTGPRRILADFLIGAHASNFAWRFLTFDEGIYKAAFPKLEVVILPFAKS